MPFARWGPAFPCHCWNAWSRSTQASRIHASAQRLHLPRERCPLAELSDHARRARTTSFPGRLKPLEKYRQVITPVSGLHHPGSLGHHHNCINIWLTGGKIGPSERNTISVDQKMAEVTAAAHALSFHGDRPHARIPRLDRGRCPASRDASLQPDLRVTLRGTQGRHRSAAESPAAQSQRPR